MRRIARDAVIGRNVSDLYPLVAVIRNVDDDTGDSSGSAAVLGGTLAYSGPRIDRVSGTINDDTGFRVVRASSGYAGASGADMSDDPHIAAVKHRVEGRREVQKPSRRDASTMSP